MGGGWEPTRTHHTFHLGRGRTGRKEQRVAGAELDRERRGLGEEGVADEVWMCHIDQREVVELARRHHALKLAGPHPLELAEIRDARVRGVKPRRVYDDEALGA